MKGCNIMKKSLFALMLLSILLCNLQPSFADEKNTFRTGIVTWPGNGIFYLAKEKGFFGDLNVEIKIIDDINALNNAYRSGALDAMGNSLDGTVFQFGNGSKGKIALIIDESRGGDGMIAANDIKSVKDLKG
jgi:NitT/TauT family transport system substrate-binding protein